MNVTTREIYNRAAAAADMHDSFVTPAQFNHWATQENLALALFLARSGWTNNVNTMTITVDGTEAGAYTLTSIDPLAIVAVHHVRGTQCRQIRLNNAVDYLRQTPGSSVATGDPAEYRVIWDQTNDCYSLGFYPEPTAGMTIVVSYIPEPARLTLDTSPAAGYANSVNYPMGWEERVVLGCARRAMEKEESDSSGLMRQIAECDQRVEQACWDRVLTEHPVIRNLDHSHRGWTDRMSYPSPLSWWWA